MKPETTKKILEEYFVLKAVCGIMGVILFVLNYFSILSLAMGGYGGYITWLFGDLTLFRISVMVPMLLSLLALFVFYALKKDMGVAKILGAILLMIDLFAFPIGTIVSIIMLGLLLLPQANLQLRPVSHENKKYRVIGGAIIAISVIGFLSSTGAVDDFFTDVGGYAGASVFVMDASLQNATGEVDVIIQLDAPTASMAAVQAQQVVIQAVEQAEGEITDSTFFNVNALRTTIDAENLVQVASQPNVKRIIPNEVIMYAPQQYECELYEPSQGSGEYTMLLDNSYKLLNIDPLWDQGLDGTGVVVAVVDTGINSKIPALQRNGQSVVIDSLQLYGEYVMWHGTAVASCIASQDSTRKGIAPGVSLLNVEVFQPNGGASYWDILKGWDWVAEWKAKHPHTPVVCCNSLGSHPLACKSGGWASPSILDEAANEMVLIHDIPMVVASGNKMMFGPFAILQYALMVNSPGQAQYVLTVGAVDDNLMLAPFSCRGGTVDGKPKPDVVAPGVRVNMFDDQGNKITKDGTSFATPLVAGCVALITEGHQDYTATQIQDCFKSGATDLGVHGYNTDYGYGMVDAEVALATINGQKPEQSYTPMFGVIIVIGVIALFIPEIKKAKK